MGWCARECVSVRACACVHSVCIVKYLSSGALLHVCVACTFVHVEMCVCECMCVSVASKSVYGRWMDCFRLSDRLLLVLEKRKEKSLLLQWQSQCQEELH